MHAVKESDNHYAKSFRALEADALGAHYEEHDDRECSGFEDAAAEATAAHAMLDWEYFDCQLFALLAERCPEQLTGPHGILLAIVKAQENLWVYPVMPLDEAECATPYLDVDRLRERWSELRMRAWAAF